MQTGLNAVILIWAAIFAAPAAAQNGRPIDPAKARVVEYWTTERRENAIARDLRIDPRGLGYLRRPDGSLVPHGHVTAALAAHSPAAAPASGDKAPPAIGNMNPAADRMEILRGTRGSSGSARRPCAPVPLGRALVPSRRAARAAPDGREEVREVG